MLVHIVYSDNDSVISLLSVYLHSQWSVKYQPALQCHSVLHCPLPSHAFLSSVGCFVQGTGRSFWQSEVSQNETTRNVEEFKHDWLKDNQDSSLQILHQIWILNLKQQQKQNNW